jgi:hypothetical protein
VSRKPALPDRAGLIDDEREVEGMDEKELARQFNSRFDRRREREKQKKRELEHGIIAELQECYDESERQRIAALLLAPYIDAQMHMMLGSLSALNPGDVPAAADWEFAYALSELLGIECSEDWKLGWHMELSIQQRRRILLRAKV